MSQRKLRFMQDSEDGILTRYEAVAGWDRPLQQGFLTVFRMGIGWSGEEVVWNNLRLSQPNMSLADIELVLSGFVPLRVIPPEFFMDLARDFRTNAGNEVKTYGALQNVRS